MSHKLKLFIFISVEMIAIVTIFLLILFAGKKSYTVTFDLNGGELLSGDVVQTVTRGQNATPPLVTKDGCFLLKWSDSYQKITRDVYAKAIWEYETTAGIEYEILPDSNYCLISGCYEELSGSVYIGAYYNNLKVLGIKDGAFEDCDKITSIYLLDGIISIGDNAFKNCSSLESIEIPETVESIGDNAFEGCEKLTEITIPKAVSEMGKDVFTHELTINVFFKEAEHPLGFEDGWYCDKVTIVYDYQLILDETEQEEIADNKNKK